jgi:hypothetical protein
LPATQRSSAVTLVSAHPCHPVRERSIGCDPAEDRLQARDPRRTPPTSRRAQRSNPEPGCTASCIARATNAEGVDHGGEVPADRTGLVLVDVDSRPRGHRGSVYRVSSSNSDTERQRACSTRSRYICLRSRSSRPASPCTAPAAEEQELQRCRDGPFPGHLVRVVDARTPASPRTTRARGPNIRAWNQSPAPDSRRSVSTAS